MDLFRFCLWYPAAVLYASCGKGGRYCLACKTCRFRS